MCSNIVILTESMKPCLFALLEIKPEETDTKNVWLRSNTRRCVSNYLCSPTLLSVLQTSQQYLSLPYIKQVWDASSQSWKHHPPLHQTTCQSRRPLHHGEHLYLAILQLMAGNPSRGMRPNQWWDVQRPGKQGCTDCIQTNRGRILIGREKGYPPSWV